MSISEISQFCVCLSIGVNLNISIAAWSVIVQARAVESDKSDESKSLKKSKSRIKSEKSDLIFYQTFGKKSTSLMEMS